MDIAAYVDQLTARARAAARSLAVAGTKKKNDALAYMADGLIANAAMLKAGNRKDLEAGKAARLSSAMLDRLTVDDKQIGKMANAVREIIALPDPVGEVIDGWVRPNGLKLHRVRVPLGVVFMIY